MHAHTHTHTHTHTQNMEDTENHNQGKLIFCIIPNLKTMYKVNSPVVQWVKYLA